MTYTPAADSTAAPLLAPFPYFGIDMKAIAERLARTSPHKHKWMEKV